PFAATLVDDCNAQPSLRESFELAPAFGAICAKPMPHNTIGRRIEAANRKIFMRVLGEMNVALYCAGSAASFIALLLIRFNKEFFQENGYCWSGLSAGI